MTDIPTLLPHTVTIDHWQCRVFGERYSIVNDDGKTILTFENELAARRQCREYGWVVLRTDDSEIFGSTEEDQP